MNTLPPSSSLPSTVGTDVEVRNESDSSGSDWLAGIEDDRWYSQYKEGEKIEKYFYSRQRRETLFTLEHTKKRFHMFQKERRKRKNSRMEYWRVHQEMLDNADRCLGPDSLLGSPGTEDENIFESEARYTMDCKIVKKCEILQKAMDQFKSGAEWERCFAPENTETKVYANALQAESEATKNFTMDQVSIAQNDDKDGSDNYESQTGTLASRGNVS